MSAIRLNISPDFGVTHAFVAAGSKDFRATKAILDSVTHTVSRVALDIFKRLQEGFKLIVAAIPIVMTIIAAASLQKNMVNLYKALRYGTAQDVKRYCLDVLRDAFNLVSYLTAALQSLGNTFQNLSQATLSLVNVISCAFGILVDSIHLVRESVHLYGTYKTAKKMDEILASKDLNAKEKVYELLKFLESRFRGREKSNEQALQGVQKNYSEMVKNFLDEQMKIELSEALGANAYEKIRSSIEELEEGNKDLDQIFFSSVNNLREVRRLLDVKIRQHVTNIVMDVIGIAAKALCIAFPQVGIAIYVVYALRTTYGVLLVANKRVEWIENRRHNAPDLFDKESFVNKKYSYEELGKVYKLLKKRIYSAVNISNGETAKKANRLAKRLLDPIKFKEFKEIAAFQLVEETKEDMKNLLHRVAIPKIAQLEDISFNNLKELKKIHQQNAKLFSSDPSAKEDWDRIKQRIFILEESLDQLFSKALMKVIRKLEKDDKIQAYLQKAN